MTKIRTVAFGFMLAAYGMSETYISYIKGITEESSNVAFAMTLQDKTSGSISSIMGEDIFFMSMFILIWLFVGLFVSTLTYPHLEEMVSSLVSKINSKTIGCVRRCRVKNDKKAEKA